MIYPDVSVKDWLKKYKVRPYTNPCAYCKHPNTVNKPFITQDSAGLCIEECGGCGKKIRLYASVPRTDKAIKEWDEVMGILE